MSALALSLLLAVYDPLAPNAGEIALKDFTVTDGARRRDIPLRVYLPAGKGASPVLLFSHGLGGTNRGNTFLGEHWARRGFVAVFVQHPGSDESVWKDIPRDERMKSMKDAASLENFLDRAADIPAVLDALTKWNQTKDHALLGRIDLTKVGMSGHSFGAVTTQAVSGQQFPFGKSFTDARIKAAIAFSPSTPRRGSAETSFGKVAIPWLLMTGTHDRAYIGGQTIQSRRGVFPALPAGSKYELVLDKAEHSAFTDRSLPGDSQPRNPNHHKVMLAFTTAFFDAYVNGNTDAKAWLDGAAAKALLEKGDVWQTK